MVAGIKTLEILGRPGAYEHLDRITSRLIAGILAAAKETGHAMCGGSISGMFGFFFCEGPVACFEDAKAAGAGAQLSLLLHSRVFLLFLPTSRSPEILSIRRSLPINLQILPSLAASIVACLSTACTWLLHSLRRASLRWRTRRLTSTALLRQHALFSRVFSGVCFLLHFLHFLSLKNSEN